MQTRVMQVEVVCVDVLECGRKSFGLMWLDVTVDECDELIKGCSRPI